MIRHCLLPILAFITSVLYAQVETGTPKIVRSEGIEMKAINLEPAVDQEVAPPNSTGDFDTPPCHPDCAKAEGQACLDKTSSLVLAKLKGAMGTPVADLATHGNSPVSVSFAINQFGDMKDIRVQELVGDKELYQKIMVALYDLPKFAPAIKDGAATGATMHLNYRYADLFEK